MVLQMRFHKKSIPALRDAAAGLRHICCWCCRLLGGCRNGWLLPLLLWWCLLLCLIIPCALLVVLRVLFKLGLLVILQLAIESPLLPAAEPSKFFAGVDLSALDMNAFQIIAGVRPPLIPLSAVLLSLPTHTPATRSGV